VDGSVALRDTFDEDPERYDRARPGYPSAVFDDLQQLAGRVRNDRSPGVMPGLPDAACGRRLLRRRCCYLRSSRPVET
jgi:hypothetical protein